MTTDRAKIEEAVRYMERCDFARDTTRAALDVVIAAAKVYVATLPKTKMVEVWRVEYCVVNGDRESPHPWRPGTWTFRSEAEARQEVARCDGNFACIRVIGPHQQEVPAP